MPTIGPIWHRKEKRVVTWSVGLAFVGLLAIMFSLGVPTTTSWSSDTTFTNTTEAADGGIELAPGDGGYVSEGWVDIPLTESPSGKVISLTVRRANYVTNPGFDNLTEVNQIYPNDRVQNTEYLDFPETNCDGCESGGTPCYTYCTPIGVGFWFTDAQWGLRPTIVEETTDAGVANSKLKILHSGDVAQIIQLPPDKDAWVRFDADLSDVWQDTDYSDDATDQALNVYVSFLDESFNRLSFTSLGTGDSIARLGIGSFQKEDSDVLHGNVLEGRLKFHTLDCDDHTLYTGGQVITATDLTRNLCKDESGSYLTVTDPTDSSNTYALSEDHMKYVMLEFDATWLSSSAFPDSTYSAANYFAYLDNVTVDVVDQVEAQLVNDAGEIVFRSNVDKGIYVPPDEVSGQNITTLRVVMRSYESTRTPVLYAAEIVDAMDLSVYVGPQLASFEGASRIVAGSGAIPPLAEWQLSGAYAQDDVRSQCIHPETGAAMSCHALLAEYGVGWFRPYLATSNVGMRWVDDGAGGGDYEAFFYGDLSVSSTYANVAYDYLDYWDKRYLPMIDRGITSVILPILNDVDEASFKTDEATFRRICGALGTDLTGENEDIQTCCATSTSNLTSMAWSKYRTCPVSVFSDFDSSPRSDKEQGVHLIETFVRFVAESFDGTYTFERSDGTIGTLPNVTDFEIFLETNQLQYSGDVDMDTWSSDDAVDVTMTQQEFWDFLSDQAYLLHDARSGETIRVASADILPKGSNWNELIDQEWMRSYALPYWDNSVTTHIDLHPYVVAFNMPEKFFDEYEVLSYLMDTVPSNATGLTWSDYPLIISEWGFTHETYDPYCIEDGWDHIWEPDSAAPQAWRRGLGEAAFAKLVASQWAVLLSLPTERISYYASFTKESAADSGDCWETALLYVYNLFDRTNTGTLDGDDLASEYEANQGGKATLWLLEELAHADPYQSQANVDSELHRSHDEPQYSGFYQLPSGEWGLALWWRQNWTYGNLDYYYGDPYYNTYADYGFQNYVYGPNGPVMDTGFEGYRKYDVHLRDFSTITSATQKSLVDGSETAVTVTSDSDGPVLSGLVVGEMPILIRFSGTMVTPDSDQDGWPDDNDCDPASSSVNAPTLFYEDSDGDGLGNPESTMQSCSLPTGYVITLFDCDDANASVGNHRTWYYDGDGDTFGDATRTVSDCTQPTGYVQSSTDCNDTNAALNPMAAETCDLIDNDCDGTIDEDSSYSIAWYIDNDRDGLGTGSVVRRTCTDLRSSGYAPNSMDRDDTVANAPR